LPTKSGERQVEPALRLLVLLAQPDPACQLGRPLFVAIDDDVFVAAACRVEAEDGSGGQPVFADDPGQHGFGIGEQLTGGFADRFVVEDGRVAPGQIPALEEGRPVDEEGDVLQFEVDGLQAELIRNGWREGFVPPETVGAGFFQRHQRGALAAGVLAAYRRILGGDLAHIAVALLGGEQLGGDAHGAGGVGDIDHRRDHT
jgi:hypothetical protein